MKEFERQWASGSLSGSPGTVKSGATAKETTRFNWRECLLYIRSQIFEHRDALEIIEDELES